MESSRLPDVPCLLPGVSGTHANLVVSLRRADHKSRRTLAALSRFDETPDELVIGLVCGEYAVSAPLSLREPVCNPV